MSILDKFKNSQAARDKAKKASDTVEKKINERTGGKYEDQIDTGQQQAEKQLGIHREQGQGQGHKQGQGQGQGHKQDQGHEQGRDRGQA